MDWCLALGPAVSFVVSFLKRFRVVARYPKVAAFALSVVTTAAQQFLGEANPWYGLAQCLAQTFGFSVTTYQVVSKPLKTRFSGGGS